MFHRLVGGLAYWRWENRTLNAAASPGITTSSSVGCMRRCPFSSRALAGCGCWSAGPWASAARESTGRGPRERAGVRSDEGARCLRTPATALSLFPDGPLCRGWRMRSQVRRLPWLFVHTALPHILLAAWFLDRTLGRLRWGDLVQEPGLAHTDLAGFPCSRAAFQKSSA